MVQQLLRMENNEGNTALHVAVEHDNTLAANRLIKKDPYIRYLPNSYGETPLYMVVLNSEYSTVSTMLNECKSIAYEAPDGMTVLHVAATNYYTDITKKILENKGKLTNVTDQYGWTPLHHAAYYTSDNNVKVLLEFDGSAAFIADKERKMTPLHMAAAMGRKDIMYEIIAQCPDCYEMVDNRGWNFLHFAAISLTINGFDELISRKSSLAYLLSQKDVDGNTPLHVCAAVHQDEPINFQLRLEHHRGYYHRSKPHWGNLHTLFGGIELKQQIQDLAKPNHNGAYKYGVVRIWYDNESSEYQREDDEDFKEMEKANASHLVAAALIATVTFAAVFTLPGGYESEKGQGQGIAILSRNAAFQAFIITDTISLLFSISAVFIHFLMSIETLLKRYRRLFMYASIFTIIAMAAMVVAFVTGTYAVLAHSTWLSIVTCILGLNFFIFVFVIMLRVIIRIRESKRLMIKLKRFVRNW